MSLALDTIPVKRRRNGNAEAVIQASIFEYIRTCAPQVLVCHIPNGGWRYKRESARLKWQGVVAGIPDLLIVGPNGIAHFIEVKTKSGTLSKEQRAIFERMFDLSCPHTVARSIDDVRDALAVWGIETRETRT